MLMGRQRRAERRWSQHGEDDRLVRELRDSLRDGYYVDIGANHPAQDSNTYRLYNLGMCGVTVDPNELLCLVNQRYRPRDSVVNVAVGAENGFARFYLMSHHGLSTFSEADMRNRQASGIKLLGVTFKPVLRLEQIFRDCVPEGRTKLELLSVDTEGWDEAVLRSNDWDRFRPRLVLVESNTPDAAGAIAGFMEEVGYRKIDTFEINGLFEDARRGS